MRLVSLASGSSGNCIYVGNDDTHLLVDVGLSGKKTEAGLNQIDLTLSDIDGILITHEHIDHIKGLGELAECFRANEPVTGCTAGKRYELSEDVHIETLWPLETGGAPQENENSSVFMINYRGIRIMV